MQQDIAVGLLLHGGAEVLPAEGVGEHEHGDDQRGAEQCPQHRAEGVGEELEAEVHPVVLPPDTSVLLLRGGGVRVPHPRFPDDGVVELGDATAHHHLDAVAALRHHAEDGRGVLQGGEVRPAPVVELESQSGRTVGEVGDVVRTTHLLEDAP